MIYLLSHKNIGILYLLLLFTILGSCGENKTVSETSVENEVFKTVKRISGGFWQEVCEKNYKNARKYTTNSSERSLVKLSQYADDITVSQFNEVDSCWFDVDSTRAYCSCLFLQNNQDKREVVQLVKENYSWKVEYILDRTNDNVLMYDYSLVDQSNVSNELDPFYRIISADIKYFDFFVNDIGANLNLGLVDVYSMKDWMEERSDEFTMSIDFFEELGRLSASTFFENKNTFEITFSNFQADKNLEIFQELVQRMVKEYGDPFNAKSLESNDYFKYNSFRWFYKSYNQQIEIRNFTTSIVVVFSTIS